MHRAAIEEIAEPELTQVEGEFGINVTLRAVAGVAVAVFLHVVTAPPFLDQLSMIFCDHT